MEITKACIKLVEGQNERFHAFCDVVLDDLLVIRDIKLIQDGSGRFLIAMPSRKISDRCPDCGQKNHLLARYCNGCGEKLAEDRFSRSSTGRAVLFADMVHPTTTAFRFRIQTAVIEAYLQEKERSSKPGYVPHHGNPEFEDLIALV